MPTPSSAFTFRPDLSPQENVEAFFNHMARIDAELAGLLRDNLSIVLNATERGRGAARQQLTQNVIAILDATPSGEGGGSS